jgi:hypothetical protein
MPFPLKIINYSKIYTKELETIALIYKTTVHEVLKMLIRVSEYNNVDYQIMLNIIIEHNFLNKIKTIDGFIRILIRLKGINDSDTLTYKNIVIQKIIQRSELTERLFSYCIRNYKNMTVEELEDNRAGTYICFNVADYIAMLWNGNVTMLYSNSKELSLDEFYNLSNRDGVYLCNVDTPIEGHAFVLYIKGNDMILYNSYGGIDRIYTLNTNTKEWFDEFIKFWTLSYKQQYEVLEKLWNLPRSAMIEIYETPSHNSKPLELEQIRVNIVI